MLATNPLSLVDFRNGITSLAWLFFLSGLLFLSPQAFGQQEVERALADQYFNGGEYEKAIELYSKLDDRDPFGVYPNYFKSLMSIRNYEGAEKLARKLSKKMSTNLSYIADIGYTYQQRGDRNKAEEYYAKALKELKPDQGQVLILANAYLMRQDYDHALEVYRAGQRMLSNTYGFHFEVAEALYQKGSLQGMIDEYLEAVAENPMNQQSVQNILQFRIGYDNESGRAELLRTSLLRRIQKMPEQTVFSEMLIWLFIQQKNFDLAGTQARALDKRLKEDGSRLLSIASMASANQQYDAAISSYQYVIGKGPDCPNYITARIEILNVSNRKLT
ncbi:MAG: tetratricopeptide repeat protein, partial [Bacteroidota bacterium]